MGYRTVAARASLTPIGPGRGRLTNKARWHQFSHFVKPRGYEARGRPDLRSIQTCGSIAKIGMLKRCR